MEFNIYFYFGLAALILASITDLKRREVPDWINFGLIFFGMIFSFIISLQTLSFSPFINSIIGVIISFLIAAFMFYTGQWGGGDAKMLMGLGALFGITYSINDIFFNLVFNIIIAGAIYGLLWSVYLSIRHWKSLILKMNELSSQKNYVLFKKSSFFFSFIFIILAIFFSEFKASFATLAILLLFTYYIFLYIKSIEEACMIKNMLPKDLTEGDWIVDNVKLGGKIFLKKKTINASDLEKIKNHKDKIDMFVNIRRKIFFIPFNLSKRLSELKEKDLILEDINQLKLKSNVVLKKEEVSSINIYLRKKSLHDVKVSRKTLLTDKKIDVSVYDLKVGDVLLDNVLVDEYLICSSKDLGIENYQIEELKKLYKNKKIDKIKVKEGIPFIPSFLMAYLMTFFMPSLLGLIIGYAI